MELPCPPLHSQEAICGEERLGERERAEVGNTLKGHCHACLCVGEDSALVRVSFCDKLVCFVLPF